MAIKLKPCPFCGGKAELRQEDFDPRWMPTRNDPDSGGCPPYYVKCDDCGANTEYRYAYPDVVKLWNMRADDKVGAGMTLDEAIGYIKVLCDAVSDQPCGCDACPYGDTVDDDGICDVMKEINKS